MCNKHCRELWYVSQMWLKSCMAVAVAVAQPSSCSPDSTPCLEPSLCQGCSPQYTSIQSNPIHIMLSFGVTLTLFAFASMQGVSHSGDRSQVQAWVPALWVLGMMASLFRGPKPDVGLARGAWHTPGSTCPQRSPSALPALPATSPPASAGLFQGCSPGRPCHVAPAPSASMGPWLLRDLVEPFSMPSLPLPDPPHSAQHPLVRWGPCLAVWPPPGAVRVTGPEGSVLSAVDELDCQGESLGPGWRTEPVSGSGKPRCPSAMPPSHSPRRGGDTQDLLEWPRFSGPGFGEAEIWAISLSHPIWYWLSCLLASLLFRLVLLSVLLSVSLGPQGKAHTSSQARRQISPGLFTQ